jgi:hypothetical protein
MKVPTGVQQLLTDVGQYPPTVRIEDDSGVVHSASYPVLRCLR